MNVVAFANTLVLQSGLVWSTLTSLQRGYPQTSTSYVGQNIETRENRQTAILSCGTGRSQAKNGTSKAAALTSQRKRTPACRQCQCHTSKQQRQSEMLHVRLPSGQRQLPSSVARGRGV
uniref:Secreted protein n=1 Tax=Haptolina brevifila TaxID=156173 RepID=A0A7S2HU67_9EUKA